MEIEVQELRKQNDRKLIDHQNIKYNHSRAAHTTAKDPLDFRIGACRYLGRSDMILPADLIFALLTFALLLLPSLLSLYH